MKSLDNVSPDTPSQLYYMSSSVQKFAGIGAILASAIAFGMTVEWANNHNLDEAYLGGLNWDKRVFNWHPVLMVCGMSLCLTTSLLSYRVIPMPKFMTKSIHGLIHTTGAVCVSVGLAAVVTSHNYKDHNTNNAYTANLYSMHSLIGLTTIVLFGLNYILGAFHFLSGFVSDEMKAIFKPNHIFFGVFTLFTAVIAIESGLAELTTKKNCFYTVSDADLNPTEHYHNLTDGCKLANGIGIMILLSIFFAAYALIGPSGSGSGGAGGEGLENSSTLSKLHP